MTKEERKKAISYLQISTPVRVMTQEEFDKYIYLINEVIKELEQEPKTGHCKDCKYYHKKWDGTESNYYTDYWCEWVDPNEDDFCSLFEPLTESEG